MDYWVMLRRCFKPPMGVVVVTGTWWSSCAHIS